MMDPKLAEEEDLRRILDAHVLKLKAETDRANSNGERAERHGAEVTRLAAEVRGLNADVMRLRNESQEATEKCTRIQALRLEDIRLIQQLRESLHSISEKHTNALDRLEKIQSEQEEAKVAEFALPEAFLEEMELAMLRFAEGYAEYGPGAADVLGLAGQWGDLHRKVMKLKRAMWSGEDGYLKREEEPEILRDIIGHCLLSLEMYQRGLEPGR
jgi:hypothetical protein